MERINKKHFEVVIIGAGQAGLATGFYLQKHKINFVIVDALDGVGGSWATRWDSLVLFTPSQFNSLPGYSFRGEKGKYPSRMEIAEYLSEYARKHNLPVYLKRKVRTLHYVYFKYEISTNEEVFSADNVVVATGAHQAPKIPSFGAKLNSKILHLHSSRYLNPSQIPPGKVLVVGAGASGVQIAIDLAKTHEVFLAGKPTVRIPDFVFRYFGRAYWWFIQNFVTVNTPLGRKARPKVLRGGGPLVNVSIEDVVAAGVKQMPRVTDVEGGQPRFEDGSVIAVDSIIWATGFEPDFSWIKMDLPYEQGWPKTDRGILEEHEGLYFVGMLFQFGITSGVIGGVGRDAQYVARHIFRRKERNADLNTGDLARRRTE